MEASQNKFKSNKECRFRGHKLGSPKKDGTHHRTSKKKTELVRKFLTLLGIVFSELVQTLFERNEMLL